MHVRLRHITAVACAAWALSALPAHAACTYPKDPGAMPDGRTATLDQMKAEFPTPRPDLREQVSATRQQAACR